MDDDDFEDNGRDGRADPAEQMSFDEFKRLRDGGYEGEAAAALAEGRVEIPAYIRRTLEANARERPLGSSPAVLVTDRDQPPPMTYDQWRQSQSQGARGE